MKQLHIYATALFGEHYSASQISKILVNANGDYINRKSVQNWIRGDCKTPDWALNQLHEECKKRELLIKKALD